MVVSSRRTHTVPTHLNLPDTVLSFWAFNLTARQLLIVLVGGGLSGDLWRQIAFLSASTVAGGALRLCLALVPLLVALFYAWFRAGGRPLELWLIVLVRYLLQSKRFVWRSMRTWSVQDHAEWEAPLRQDDIEGEVS